ncbi:uncharacterized protein TRAVEDRAFT_22899 [Trametes versicolor FP-101664 SS1]|uniref:uncharacterized protein n=1 Tax=Trametes versicolor (strain FP-101664) TaxID=717944 RepID=UPI00046237F1|nr:uncharacterized protein TRAVEDRAFT_22899 [Trametes versicolor FP-101664 SS1]EIW55133.1 hypothetical protein TRAVEDRAFT_22899 [Trametes versicolor FP-101664 SS1]
MPLSPGTADMPVVRASADDTLTFPREVERIWKRGFSTPVILFYLVRYTAMMSALIIILDLAGWRGRSDSVISLRVYTFVELNIRTSPVPASCVFATDVPDTVYENWIIGARSSAVLTDLVVLGITIWKARPVHVQGVKLGVKCTMVSILMRDGVLYFGVLLIANLIGLTLVRFFASIQPIYTWIAMLTAIMTARFILDLHEAADPRFGSLSTDGGISALIFPDTSKHAPHVNHDVSPSSSTVGTDWIDQSSENGSVDVGECDDAEWEVLRNKSYLASGTNGRTATASQCKDIESIIWIR